VSFVELIEKKETLDFGKDLNGHPMPKIAGSQPPFAVGCFVNLTNKLVRFGTLVGYKRWGVLIDKNGALVFHRGTIGNDSLAVW